MASGILAVPKEHLLDVIWIIRKGIKQAEDDCVYHLIAPEVITQLTKWCDNQENLLPIGTDGKEVRE